MGVKTGATARWLTHELPILRLEAVYIEARNVCAAGTTQIMKSDLNDADG
jgi:hypothetical protein